MTCITELSFFLCAIAVAIAIAVVNGDQANSSKITQQTGARRAYLI